MTEQLREIKKKYPELAKMTVEDVVKTKKFSQYLKSSLEAAWIELNKFEISQHVIVHHPLKKLDKSGLLDLPKLKVEYIKIIDKKSMLPASQRQIIKAIGSMAYVKTIEKLMKKYGKK